MFQTLIYPSSGACDCAVELPHVILFSVRCVLEIWCSWVWVESVLQAEACNTDTTPTQPHRNSNTQRTKNNTTNVVIQQHSRKLLMKEILMSETCWAHKKWNKIASDIKLVFYSSTILQIFIVSLRYSFPYACYEHIRERRRSSQALVGSAHIIWFQLHLFRQSLATTGPNRQGITGDWANTDEVFDNLCTSLNVIK